MRSDVKPNIIDLQSLLYGTKSPKSIFFSNGIYSFAFESLGNSHCINIILIGETRLSTQRWSVVISSRHSNANLLRECVHFVPFSPTTIRCYP